MTEIPQNSDEAAAASLTFADLMPSLDLVHLPTSDSTDILSKLLDSDMPMFSGNNTPAGRLTPRSPAQSLIGIPLFTDDVTPTTSEKSLDTTKPVQARPRQKPGRKRKGEERDPADQAHVRTIRNREAAQASRDRKRQHLTNLEESNKRLCQENSALQARVVAAEANQVIINTQLQVLSNQLATVMTAMANAGLTIPDLSVGTSAGLEESGKCETYDDDIKNKNDDSNVDLDPHQNNFGPMQCNGQLTPPPCSNHNHTTTSNKDRNNGNAALLADGLGGSTASPMPARVAGNSLQRRPSCPSLHGVPVRSTTNYSSQRMNLITILKEKRMRHLEQNQNKNLSNSCLERPMTVLPALTIPSKRVGYTDETISGSSTPNKIDSATTTTTTTEEEIVSTANKSSPLVDDTVANFAHCENPISTDDRIVSKLFIEKANSAVLPWPCTTPLIMPSDSSRRPTLTYSPIPLYCFLHAPLIAASLLAHFTRFSLVYFAGAAALSGFWDSHYRYRAPVVTTISTPKPSVKVAVSLPASTPLVWQMDGWKRWPP